MKCLILAGGRGERLWPLSRKNYPKQFIQIQKNHSIFQETIARNMPYCDEFIIVTSLEYRYIVESQMAAFQGVTFRCIYEEVPRKTAPAILLACMELQPSELVFVAAADQLIDTGEEICRPGLSYKEAILAAKRLALAGHIVTFGLDREEKEERDQRFGWILHEGNTVVRFVEKPDREAMETIRHSEAYLQNAGLLLFENGILQQELSRAAAVFYDQCVDAFGKRQLDRVGTIYRKQVLEGISPEYMEKLLLEKLDNMMVVECGFDWADVGKLEDLTSFYEGDQGISVKNRAKNTVVINHARDQLVLVNGTKDLMVVNTPDAVYIGRYGESDQLKEILTDHEELRPYFDKSTVYYRSWGYYQQLYEDARYRIRRVVLYPGKTIYAHSHRKRSENWTIVQGQVSVIKDGARTVCQEGANIDIPVGTVHQISNISRGQVVFVETACGEILHEQDMVSDPVADLNEYALGYASEPFVRLSPAYKDYLWGGRKLREIYGKNCDYETIAESWELSAHPDGQSIVAGGRHKGLTFGAYLNVVGREVLGWKCSSMTDFPLLVKFIDARDNLSVQVHPDDDYALDHENQYGKNEMWYILDCQPGSFLYVGFNREVSREEVRQRVEDHTILEILNRLPTHPGDVFFIPAGTVHAIGGGNLLCEIQQSSNCTYRLYDYGRKDKYGKERELHLQKALDVLDYGKYQVQEFESSVSQEGTVLSRCKYFETRIYHVEQTLVLTIDDSRFRSLLCIEGKGTISCGEYKETIKAGDSIFIRAFDGEILLQGNMKVILSHI